MKQPAPLWTPAQDDRLMDLLAEGFSFAKAGELLGRTKGACVSRFKRLCELMGAQAT
jgi:hypothetical protein